ncbi:MAG: tetratricopeptide repeat protein [Acidobacteria bacterium]|nr:tetratricopeptide repeat protein [Acidobacteriota bacterium]
MNTVVRNLCLVLFLNLGIQALAGQENPDLLRDWAAHQASANRFLEAAGTLELYLQRRPEDIAARMDMARLLGWGGRYRESAAAYRQVLQAQPENAEARLGLARVLSWGRRYGEALEQYGMLLEEDPANREAGIEQARVHAWKGNLSRASELYSDLQKLYPNDRDVLLGRSQALQWGGRLEEAREALVLLLQWFPGDQEVLLALARTQSALGRQDLAWSNLEQASVVGPENEELKRLRPLVLRQLRPVLVLGFNPSFDSDSLRIYPYISSLQFTLISRVRSYARGAVTSSMTPGSGITQGREVAFGSSLRAPARLTLRSEIGGNSVPSVSSVSAGGTSMIASGGFSYLPAPSLGVDFQVGREFLNYLPRATALGISRVHWQAGGDWQPSSRLSTRVDYFHSRYSDTNRANGGSLSVTRTLPRGERLTVAAGYLYSISGFTKQLGNGYFDPSQFQRHAGVLRLSGRMASWLGYSLSGTLGAEQQFRDPFRADGTFQAASEIALSERLRLSLGYGFFRTASLERAGAYRTQTASAGLEILF